MDRYGVVVITDYTSEYGPSTQVEMRPAATGEWVRFEDVRELAPSPALAAADTLVTRLEKEATAQRTQVAELVGDLSRAKAELAQAEAYSPRSLREDSIAWRAVQAALAPHAQPGENTAGTLARILGWWSATTPVMQAHQERVRAEERERAARLMQNWLGQRDLPPTMAILRDVLEHG